MSPAAFLAKSTKLARILASAGWRHALLVHGVAAGTEHEVVLRQLGDVRTVVDIGANRGQFALAARACLPNSRIVSFEPLPGPARKYCQVFHEDENTTVVESAIGPRAERATIHVAKRDDSSSLLPITATQVRVSPGTGEVATAYVRVAPLGLCLKSTEISTPALLKLDVQGYELQALIGCDDLLSCFSWVYVECSFMELYGGQALVGEVMAWLHSRGFRLDGIYNLVFDASGRTVQGDFLLAQCRQLDQTLEQHAHRGGTMRLEESPQCGRYC